MKQILTHKNYMDTNYRVGWSKTSVAITLAVFAVVIGIIVGLLIEGTPIVSVEFLIIGLVLICLLYVASYAPTRIETGPFVSYVTDWHKAILIDAGTKKYMVSCNNPDKLVVDIDELKNT